ncbi:MAG: hypothetical protein IT380_11720 [Myxococcales bacterium]|nr:hypothetical protein [Myxococcales bacterium]
MIRQSFLMVVLGFLALVPLSGCNAVTVGNTCESRTDCLPGQDCYPTPGGFCTRGCTEPGRTQDCPSGTICTFFGKNQVCSPICESNGDCRVNYVCVEAGGTTALKACRPE